VRRSGGVFQLDSPLENAHTTSASITEVDSIPPSPTPPPPPTPTPAASSQDCTQLGWSPITGNVCGHATRNFIPAGCPDPKKVFQAAAATACMDAGARLCTVNEVVAGAGKSTGCGTDSAYLWTSDVCTLRAGTPQRTQGFSIVRGWGMTNGAIDQACASPDTTSKPFRCCADHAPTSQARLSCNQLGWSIPGGKSSCGMTENLGGFGEMATCYHKHDWSFATEVCARSGARLCSLAEVQSGVGVSTGCSADRKRIWTGEPCAQSSAETYYYTIKGNGKSGSLTCDPASKNRRIRCCSDSAATLPGPTLTLAQVAPPISEKSCSSTEQASWKKSGTKCASSLIPNAAGDETCWATRTWQEANNICLSAGARLCTLAEATTITLKTGCSLDYQYVWLASSESSSCTDNAEYKVVKPKQAVTKCKANTKTAGVRCCSSN
jgi:hypothetical protein